MRRAPVVLAGVYLTLLLFTLPAAWLVHESIAGQLGESMTAGAVARGGELDWLHEFRGQATGLASDVGSSTAGFAAVLRNASDLVDRAVPGGSERPSSRASWLLVLGWWLAGTFLSGGILDRYARMRPLHAQGFFGACGGAFFRLLRLNLGAIAIYWVVVGSYGRLASLTYSWATADLASERAAFGWALGLLIPGLLLFAVVTIAADCARVRMIVEDRRSAIFALAAGARFAIRSARALSGLYLLLAAALGVLVLVYAMVAPGAGSPLVWARGGLLLGSLYILGRVFLKLLTYASATSLFQSALAHAGYVAPPMPVWPESPAIETLGPAAEP